MSKKFLKSLNYDDAKSFIFQNDTLKSWIEESKWDANKHNGIKLERMATDSKPIKDKFKDLFNFNDAQMEYICAYFKLNNPDAIIGAGF